MADNKLIKFEVPSDEEHVTNGDENVEGLNLDCKSPTNDYNYT